MPLQETSGNATADSYGGGVATIPNYIEDVFSTYLYTGTGAALTITNGIDLSTKGGLVWIKSRSAATNHNLFDTAQGATKLTHSNTTAATVTDANSITAFNTTGFTLGSGNTTGNQVNTSAATYASWTFRKQPKFFDVVTYTGNGTAGRTIAHSLGSVPGCMIVRPTSAVDDWFVYHRSLLNSQSLFLNLTAAASNTPSAWNSTTPTDTVFTVGTNSATNANGVSYVAYLFAHDAGGFGLTGTDNVISCGSFTCSSGAATVSLGYEPQWLMIKRTDSSASYAQWYMVDTMRGFGVFTSGVNNDKDLYANLTNAEADDNILGITSTGFAAANLATSGTYIYIAIRRGPMKVPTSGTSVLDMQTYTGTQAARTITTANTVDLSFTKSRDTAGTRWNWTDRLRGATRTLDSSLTAAEASDTTGYTSFAVQKGYTLGTGDTYDVNTSGRTYVSWNFTRTPGFFDEVCYTGTGTSTAFNHNLGVAPEMIITKIRNSAFPNWGVWHNALSPSSAMLFLNTTGTQGNGYVDTVTSTTFSFATANGVVNSSGNTYVAYLFATCAGVSKVGSYTGTGTTLQVNCGFTGGARFVLIKRTDSTGDWYVWDSARGIVSGNDPYLLLNSTAAEVTNTDYIDTYSAGFEISSTAPAAINASSGTFIFLAIA